MNEMFTYEVLTTVYRMEMKSPILTNVQPDLYKRMNNLYCELDVKYKEARATDMNSSATDRFSTQRKNARNTIMGIKTLRMSKVSSMAVRKAMGDNPDVKNLTPEEKILYNNIAEIIQQFDREVSA